MKNVKEQQPHQWHWYVEQKQDEDYLSHLRYTVKAKPVSLRSKRNDSDSPAFQFEPTICEIIFGRENEEREQIATLIAATPELFKAAETCANICNQCNNAMLPQSTQELLKSIENILTEAISKAKGDVKC